LDKRFIYSYHLYLIDNDLIVLPRGDPHKADILISWACPPQIVAIVDWGPAGWYPEYWNFVKPA
jgi:hypothetical protein